MLLKDANVEDEVLKKDKVELIWDVLKMLTLDVKNKFGPWLKNVRSIRKKQNQREFNNTKFIKAQNHKIQ